MRGHEEILQMRLIDKVTPIAIFVHDCELVDKAFECEFDSPSVSLSSDDVMYSLDLRFVMGCEVHAIFHNECRAKAFFERATQFRPEKCFACVVHDDRYDADGELWMGVYTNKQGVING